MTHEIVAPEPHSTGNSDHGWEHIPRWLRIVLCVVAIAAMVLVAYFTR
jgi:hypothetical protein